MRLIKIISILLLAIIAIALVAGYLFEEFSRNQAEKDYSLPGEMVDIGGHRLHALIQGEGSPTIVFESGHGPDGHLAWSLVQDKLSSITTTLSYDRSGILFSERGYSPKSVRSAARELKLLLERSDCPRPYILAAHSMGGLVVRSFVHYYPEDVVGIVLVDTTVPGIMDEMSDGLLNLSRSGDVPTPLVMFANRFGLVRLFFGFDYPNTDPGAEFNRMMNAVMYKGIAAMQEESIAFYRMMEETRYFTDWGDIPLVVISAAADFRKDEYPSQELGKEMDRIHAAKQKEQLAYSSNSRQIQAENSTHFIQFEEPDLVVKALESLVINTSP